MTCLLMVGLALYAQQASAQSRWQPVSQANSSPLIELDTTSIKGQVNGQDGLYDVWFRVTHRKPIPLVDTLPSRKYIQFLDRERISCSQSRWTHLESIYYTQAGATLEHYADIDRPAPMTTPIPDTVGEAMLRGFCKYIKGHPSMVT